MRADDEPFIEIYRCERGGLFRLAMLVCGEKSRAEEAVAEGFARVLPRWRSGKLEDPALYLRRAVMNQLLGGFRRLALERAYAELRTGDERGAQGIDERVIDHGAVWAALCELPVRQRAAVVLRYYEDLTESEAAQVLGVRLGTVKSRVSRALVRLRELLAEENVDA